MMKPKRKWGWGNPVRAAKPDTRMKLIKRLDAIFSKFVRLRDSKKYETDFRTCWCITCSKPYRIEEMDAGHFVSRDHMATRYDERNVHAQCPSCNRFHSGRQFEHGQAIDRLYGAGTADLLTKLGNARGTKIDTLWLLEKIEEYKEKVKKLTKG